MKTNPNSDSGIFTRRTLLALVLVSTGLTLGLVSFATTSQDAVSGQAILSGARIYVTTTAQKIGGIGTGGCSLQEAIYSAVLHDSLDGGAHGIAIDATDPDHFITTECVMGTGNGDSIVLPSGGVFQLSSSLDDPSSPLGVDAYNYMGPTATPIIFSTMTIEAAGATLQWVGSGNSRLFAIGQATIKTPNGTASGTGGVTIRNAYIKGFHVKGGDGVCGGGGGLGAGGAIYVHIGTLVVENSTFDGNQATGGNGTFSDNDCLRRENQNLILGADGGGGGLSGNGGRANIQGAGGGGGGARGNGGTGGNIAGGGGGGTLFDGGNADTFGPIGGAGGYLHGGLGGDFNNDGHDASFPGGGGGGGGAGDTSAIFLHGDGGNGNYGGGGGAAGQAGESDIFQSGNTGGAGGFGGGGGAGDHGACCAFIFEPGPGGSGGFGGGSGSGSPPGNPGPFGGANGLGGGGALGGAIFNDSGTITIHNSTFYDNSVARGVSVGGFLGSGDNGGDAGGAIFSHNGSLTLVNVTVSANQSTGSGGGVVVYGDSGITPFVLENTIIANNGANECYTTGGGTVASGGAGNLITRNGAGTPLSGCPGVVINVDPQLQALQPTSVNGGKTPTMAIPLYSSAMGFADPKTSLPSDQRFADRPQPDKRPRNGYDIGAFTVCRGFMGPTLRYMFCSETHIPPVSTTTLTMQASPSAGGTTNPQPGNNTVDQGSVVYIQALPNPGYHFVNWTGQVADPNNSGTTVIMSQPRTVTANFAVSTPTATPTPTPTSTPTATPTPSPTSSPTPTSTPSPTPCGFGCGGSPTPTPTPTPCGFRC